MKAIVIYPSGQVLAENLPQPTHKGCADKVGGLFEIVYRPMRLKQPYCMIVNEDFLRLELPINPVGCYLYGADQHGHPICGTIVISKIQGPDLVSLTDNEAKEISKTMTRLMNLLKEENIYGDKK